MHRLIVVILSAVDAAIAAAVGIAATLAPLTLLWVLGMGGTADWGLLWPTSATIWQFGNLVPLQVTLPGDYLAVAGIDPGAASFVLSLAPLAFASFTAIFAARSGVRASQADAWVTGVLTGSLGFAALTAVIALSSGNDLAAVERWQAILFPSLVFAIPLLVGAVVTEWREAGSGFIARARDRIEAAPHGWGEVPGLIVRGGAVALAGLDRAGRTRLRRVARAARRRGHRALRSRSRRRARRDRDHPRAARVPADPRDLGHGVRRRSGIRGRHRHRRLARRHPARPVPGIPALGALPESTTPWLLLLALLPVALGALAGWIARSRLRGASRPSRMPRRPRLPIDGGCRARPRPQLGTRGSAGGVATSRPPGAAEQDARRRARTMRRRGAEPDAQSDPIGARHGHRAGHRRARGRGRGPAVRPRVGLDRARAGSPRSVRSRGPSPSPSDSRCCSARRSCCSRRDAARRPRRRARRRPMPQRRR